jgi:type II secretory pathway pseudopilin PulG
MTTIHTNPFVFRSRQRPCRPGFSLIEAIVSTLIVGTVVVSSLYSSLSISRSYRKMAESSRASLLAESYMTEILRASYEDPVEPILGPEPDEGTTSRIDFDDVDDYHGRVESPPQLRGGESINKDNLENFTVAIEVLPTDPKNVEAIEKSIDSGLKRITVEVTDGVGQRTRLFGLKSRLSGERSALAIPMQEIQWVGLRLGTEDGSQTLYTGTSPLNRATSNIQ